MGYVTTNWGTFESFTDVPRSGSVLHWSDPEDAAIEDGTNNSASVNPKNGWSNYLTGTRSIFATENQIPEGAEITGIEIAIKRLQVNASYPNFDSIVSLTLDGTNNVGNNKASSDLIPNMLAFAYYGSTNDTWGINLTWNNNLDFGVQYSVVKNYGDFNIMFVDVILMRLTYFTNLPTKHSTFYDVHPNTALVIQATNFDYDDQFVTDSTASIDNSGLNRSYLSNHNLDRYLFADLQLSCVEDYGSAFATGQWFELYMICEKLQQDGASYADIVYEDGDAAIEPPAANFIGTFQLNDNSIQKHILRQIPLPPLMIKFLVINKADLCTIELALRAYRYKILE